MKPSPFNVKAWNRLTQSWFDPIFYSGHWFGSHRELDDYITLDFKNVVIVRSVGFCDRNGTEIYQKDYVKIFSKKLGNSVHLVDWIPELAKFGWGGCTPGGTQHSFSMGNGAKIFEVVGNEFQGV